MNDEVEKMKYFGREKFGWFISIIQNPSNLKELINCIRV